MIQKGFDLNKPDRFGVYPLQHAILLKDYEIVECFLKTEKIDFSVKINMNQMINGTYLDLAIYSNFDILKLLYETKAIDASAVDGYGDSPLNIVQRHFNNNLKKENRTILDQLLLRTTSS